jgi:diguanylate cyclase (GGDEF)-like protein
MVEARKRRVTISWFFVVPTILFAIYHISEPSLNGQYISVLGILILMILVSLFPIQLPGTNLSLIQGVQLALFLQYGIFLEVIVTQLAVFFTIRYLRVPLKDHSRYTTNSLMFLIVSITCALVFYLLGGEVGQLKMNEYPELTPILGYTITGLIANHAILYLIRAKVFKTTPPQMSELVLESLMVLVVLPVGVILFIIHSQIGPQAILYVGLPYIVSVFIVNLYLSSQKINDLLQQTSKIGQKLTESFNVDEILDIFMQNITKIFEVDHAYILGTTNDEPKLSIVRVVSERQSLMEKRMLETGQGIIGRVLRTGESLRYDQRSQWRKLAGGALPLTAQSVLVVPMIRNQEIVGIVIFASNKKFAYKKHHLMIVEIMSNYLAVAIDKARNYSETKKKSERCPLTNLYNYRYFEEKLDEMFKQDHKNFSVILIDLDHFKRVNDTFGHQSGNDVLCEIANRLKKACAGKGLVARYGGEEFVVLLRDLDQTQAYRFAESIRHTISSSGIQIHKDLGDYHRDSILLTASIGVATAPEQGEDPLTLTRNADRAMYTGAKQKGRNKVASYVG